MTRYTQDLFLIRKARSYFGHINYVSKPTIFVFKKETHADAIRKRLTQNTFEIDDHQTATYKVSFTPVKQPSKWRIPSSQMLQVEYVGYFDLSIYVSLNSVNAHIVDDIIEDDEGNLYLVNHHNKLEPIHINDNMVKMHLQKL